MSNKKGSTNIVLIILVVVVAGALGYMVLFKKSASTEQPNDSQNTTLPASETTNWKVYRNEKYGFEFKYPSQFYIVSESSGDTESGDVRFSVALDDDQFKGQERPRRFTTVSVYQKSSLEIFLSGLVDDMTGAKLNITKQEKVSDNPVLYKIYIGNSNNFQGVAVRGSTYVYMVSGSGPTVDQIISTFRFTR